MGGRGRRATRGAVNLADGACPYTYRHSSKGRNSPPAAALLRTRGRNGRRSPMRRNLAIVPAFNEADAIVATVAAIHKWAPDFDVLVVDDGSTDDTAGEASRSGAAVLQMPFNLGIGGAMQA